MDAAACRAGGFLTARKNPSFTEKEGLFCENYHLRLRAASAFFLRLTLGFS